MNGQNKLNFHILHFLLVSEKFMFGRDELRFFWQKSWSELITFTYAMSECMSFVKVFSISFAKSYI